MAAYPPIPHPLINDLKTLLTLPNWAPSPAMPTLLGLSQEAVSEFIQTVSAKALTDFIASRASNRLGVYAESLLAFTLLHHPEFTLLCENLQVMDKQRVIGAYDFIYHNSHTDEVIHCELALKFYLGLATPNDTLHWVGPRLRDRLDIKYEHMCSHQINLANTAQGKATLTTRGIPLPNRHHIFIGGRCFTPEPTHSAQCPWQALTLAIGGHWMTVTEFKAHLSDPKNHQVAWYALPRLCWLAPPIWHSQASLTAATLPTPHSFTLQGPLLVARGTPVASSSDYYQPDALCFVVPDGWAPEALAYVSTSHERNS